MKDYIMMPKELTSENGAKYLMMGEFTISVVYDCQVCSWEFTNEMCEVCGGKSTYVAEKVIPWDTIKDIYSKVVEHLGDKNG
jgi:hypothetical protein